jgi:type IV secretion system protein TrbC
MRQRIAINNTKILGMAGLTVMLSAAPAYAQTAMPWESPLRQLLTSLQGPTAQTIIILAIIIAGLAFAVGESGSFFRRCAAAVFGGAIAMGASTWVPSFFN